MNNGAMLNAYPDSLGGRLSDIVEILRLPEFENAFRSFYILPSLFHSDLDRGFSVIDYGLDEKRSQQIVLHSKASTSKRCCNPLC